MTEKIKLYFTNELSPNERVELLKEIESDQKLRDEFIHYQNIQALLSFSDNIVNPKESRQKYYSFLSEIARRKAYRLILKFISYAAAIITLALAIHLYDKHNYTSGQQTVAETTLFVPAGQRINITLQDGTSVWLNAQSKLTYPSAFTGSERRVSLEGEAYFEVSHNRKMPFIVYFGGTEIKVLGTSFNVNSYPQEEFSRISLIEGRLEVYNPLINSERIVLEPNQEMTIRNGQAQVALIPHIDYFLWKDGIYSFNNEEFGVILKKLELYYDIGIIVKDSTLLKGRYTVKFRQRDGIDEIMRLMQKIHPFRIQKDEENNWIAIDK